MAIDYNDHMQFKMNNLLSIKNKDGDKHLTFTAYGGNIQMSFGPNTFEKGKRPRSVNVTPHMAHVLMTCMKKILDKPEPGKKFTIVYNGEWNKETKRRELSFTCTIGMGDNAVCYIAIKHVDKQTKETWSGLFDLIGDRYLEVTGLYDDEKNRSFMTLGMIYNLFQQNYFGASALLTRNYMTDPSKFSRSNQSSVGSSSSSEDQIEF